MLLKAPLLLSLRTLTCSQWSLSAAVGDALWLWGKLAWACCCG